MPCSLNEKANEGERCAATPSLIMEPSEGSVNVYPIANITGGSPMRENNRRRIGLMSVIVPTVERELPPSRFWLTMIAVDRLSMISTLGFSYLGRKLRAKAVNVSLSWRCASALMVSNTIDDLPEPDTPVKIVIFRLGMRSDTFLRLFSRAPSITLYSY